MCFIVTFSYMYIMHFDHIYSLLPLQYPFPFFLLTSIRQYPFSFPFLTSIRPPKASLLIRSFLVML